MNSNNLKPIHSSSEAKEKGRIGGIKSGETRRKKKIMSMIYADILNAGEKNIKKSVIKIIEKGGIAFIMLLREMREATEGKAKTPIDLNRLLS